MYDEAGWRGMSQASILKFNNFFKANLTKLLVEEEEREMRESDTNKAPKYSVCFMDLAEFLNIKDDIAAKI